MTIKQKKAVIRNFAELTNGRELDGALAHFDPSFIDHAVRQGMPTGIEGARMFFKMVFTAFPDLHETIEDIIGEGDKVVNRMTCESTYKGVFMVALPTGKHVKWSFIEINQIVDGKVVKHLAKNAIGLMPQLAPS